MSLVMSLAVTHAPWMPGRPEALARLNSGLGDTCTEDFAGGVLLYEEKATNAEWSGIIWEWSAARLGVDWCVFLQDDTLVAPDFAARLREVLGATSADVVGLHVAHPLALPLHLQGYAAITTADALVGVGYAVRQEALSSFLEWRANQLNEGWERPAAEGGLTEDTMLALWCAATGRRVLHPLPGLVDHDITVSSAYGNDKHEHRTASVRWDGPPRGETPRSEVPHLGRFYDATPFMLKRWVKGIAPEVLTRVEADTGGATLRRLRHERLAGMPTGPRRKVFIATPVRGRVTCETLVAVWQLQRDESFDAETSFEVTDLQYHGEDVVRVRSRIVSYFLRQTDATHLFFLDSDVYCQPHVLKRMLDADRPFVAAPYPRRDGINWTRVRERLDVSPEAAAYSYAVDLGEGKEARLPDAQGCIPALHVPLGCALLERTALEHVTSKHPELVFEDRLGPSVALFQLMLHGNILYGEDFSFCERWRRAGLPIALYLGQGSPVDHIGEHIFKGAIESFGLRRARK